MVSRLTNNNANHFACIPTTTIDRPVSRSHSLPCWYMFCWSFVHLGIWTSLSRIMGNLCPWCVKKEETSSSLSNGRLTDSSGVFTSQFPVDVDDRTPFVDLTVFKVLSMNRTCILDCWTNPIIMGTDRIFTTMVNHPGYSRRLHHNH